MKRIKKKNIKNLSIPPEPLGLKLQMQKMFLSQSKSADDRIEWRIAIKQTQKDIKKYGLFRPICQLH